MDHAPHLVSCISYDDGGHVFIHNSSSGDVVSELQIEHCVYTPVQVSSNEIALTSEDGVYVVTLTGNPIPSLRKYSNLHGVASRPNSRETKCLSRIPRTKFVASSGTRDSTVALWDVNTGSVRYRFTQPSVKFLTHGIATPGLIVCSCGNGRIRVWDARKGTCVRKANALTDSSDTYGDAASDPECMTHDPVRRLHYSSMCSLGSEDEDKAIAVWDDRTWDRVGFLRSQIGNFNSISGLHFLNNSEYGMESQLLAWNDYRLYVLDVRMMSSSTSVSSSSFVTVTDLWAATPQLAAGGDEDDGEWMTSCCVLERNRGVVNANANANGDDDDDDKKPIVVYHFPQAGRLSAVRLDNATPVQAFEDGLDDFSSAYYHVQMPLDGLCAVYSDFDDVMRLTYQHTLSSWETAPVEMSTLILSNETEGRTVVPAILGSNCCRLRLVSALEKQQDENCEGWIGSRALLSSSPLIRSIDETSIENVENEDLMTVYLHSFTIADSPISADELLAVLLGSSPPISHLYAFYRLFRELQLEPHIHAVCSKIEDIQRIEDLVEVALMCFPDGGEGEENEESGYSVFAETILRKLRGQLPALQKNRVLIRSIRHILLDLSHPDSDPLWTKRVRDHTECSTISSYPTSFDEVMEETCTKLYLTRRCPNVVLITRDGGEEKAHIEILIARSMYFLVMLRNEMEELTEYRTTRKLQVDVNLSHGALCLLLSVIYTGKIVPIPSNWLTRSSDVTDESADDVDEEIEEERKTREMHGAVNSMSDLLQLAVVSHKYNDQAIYDVVQEALIHDLKQKSAPETLLLFVEVGHILYDLPDSLRTRWQEAFEEKFKEGSIAGALLAFSRKTREEIIRLEREVKARDQEIGEWKSKWRAEEEE